MEIFETSGVFLPVLQPIKNKIKKGNINFFIRIET
jgi:hypothetical protein